MVVILTPIVLMVVGIPGYTYICTILMTSFQSRGFQGKTSFNSIEQPARPQRIKPWHVPLRRSCGSLCVKRAIGNWDGMREPSRERIHIRTLGKFGKSSSSKVISVWGYMLVTGICYCSYQEGRCDWFDSCCYGSFRDPHPPLPGGSPYSLFSSSFVPQGLNLIRGNMAAGGGGPLKLLWLSMMADIPQLGRFYWTFKTYQVPETKLAGLMTSQPLGWPKRQSFSIPDQENDDLICIVNPPGKWSNTSAYMNI